MAVVEEAAQSALGGSEGIMFDNRIAPDLCANADREQVFRIVLNLIRNASQALPNIGGTITASAARNAGRIEIDVADSGCGVSDAVRATLFQPFASARAGGSGLGLAIARELARGHGGELSLVETGPRGTVFRFVLPDRG
jgi:signal transduction histidine kinase